MKHCPAGHPHTPENRYKKDRGTGCSPCQVARHAQWRVAKKTPPPDGLEVEFGPCPPRESRYESYDWVAVEHALFGGGSLNRAYTTREIDEIVSRSWTWEASRLAASAGVSDEMVKRWRATRKRKALRVDASAS